MKALPSLGGVGGGLLLLLGLICILVEVPLHLAGAKPYELALPELFFDLGVLWGLLLLVPKKVRPWVSGTVVVLLYAIAFVDMFCYVRFESTLTPTMLMLALETDGRETTEFFRSYVGWDLPFTKLGWLLLVLAAHVAWLAYKSQKPQKPQRPQSPQWPYRLLAAAVVLTCGVVVWPNKTAMWRLFTHDTIGEVEHDLTRKDCANLYLPVYRLAFSLYANHLAAKQIDQLTMARQHIRVDSCSHLTPNIVLIIGESYNRYHSQLYGYDQPTTPRQLERAQDSSLVVFTDVVAPWNLTSYVFKNFLSLHAVGDAGEWCDAPLFPEVFRKAGYRVTFLTNQFMSKPSEKVYDFSGGFFLNNPTLSAQLFDERNPKLFHYDEGLLTYYDRMARDERPTLTIFHLMGQHLDYYSRYPKNRRHFKAADYHRPDLNQERLGILADYDNSLLYNDSVVNEVLRRFEQQDAVVIYMPDHAEEAHNPPRPMYGRLHSVSIDYRLAREEFEIPFWIWCSPQNRERHPDLYASVRAARQRPFMTDNLPHLLLHLAGIHTPDYRPEYDLLSPQFNPLRPRLLKNQKDYNKLR